MRQIAVITDAVVLEAMLAAMERVKHQRNPAKCGPRS